MMPHKETWSFIKLLNFFRMGLFHPSPECYYCNQRGTVKPFSIKCLRHERNSEKPSSATRDGVLCRRDRASCEHEFAPSSYYSGHDRKAVRSARKQRCENKSQFLRKGEAKKVGCHTKNDKQRDTCSVTLKHKGCPKRTPRCTHDKRKLSQLLRPCAWATRCKWWQWRIVRS